MTGSNASGKSTFIKSLAVNSILAQTIHTCAAKEFKLRPSLVITSMAVRDSISEGESYFIKEIKSLKRILNKVQNISCTCFIDEILKGTNTIERIAASAAVLKYLHSTDCLCMTASHDIELTCILENEYDNYHFSEHITDDEFEALLDQLHGKGKFEPASVSSSAAEATPPAAPAKPAEKTTKPAAAKAPAAAPTRAEAPARGTPAAASATAEKPASEAETTVRVDTARLDEIMNMVGELVLVRNRLVRLGASSGDEAMAKAVSNLDVVTADLQSAVMKTRMQPIKKVFGRFPRLVRDLARSLKKEINLELVGEETDLDKNLVEALADPLVHLVRNAVDHGIETPEDREAAGKPRTGRVVLSAEQEGDHILLMITDDGKGMDANVLRAKAVEKGMLDKDAADRLSDLECYNLIFAPGFSTKTEISDVSGRGVGMDVVKTKISQLNGTVNVFSTKGQGSKVVIKVPLTLAIMPTLMVMLGNQAFAFPLVNVNEIFHLDLSRTNVVDGQEVIIVRDKALPLFYLKRWLVHGAADEEQGEGHVVILSVGNQSIGFVVDQLVGQEEVVIKPLGKMLQGTPGMSGATITGDGRIALILDVPSMLKRYARRA
ncbi:MAG TPA: hypothetical protein DHU88_13350 [Pseudomonas sp.]|nr:hypothetical protein [Pseudomonas sp.]